MNKLFDILNDTYLSLNILEFIDNQTFLALAQVNQFWAQKNASARQKLIAEHGYQLAHFKQLSPLWVIRYREQVIELINQGFPISFIQYLDPSRVAQAPFIDVLNLAKADAYSAEVYNPGFWEEHSSDYIDWIKPKHFPANTYAIYGRDDYKRLFFCMINSKNQVVSFFERYGSALDSWIFSAHLSPDDMAELATVNQISMRSTINQATFVPKVFYHQGQRLEQSLVAFEQWMALFFAYFSLSCPNPDGSDVDLNQRLHITHRLLAINSKAYPLIDAQEHPELSIITKGACTPL